MSDLKELLDREARRVDEAPGALESVLRRRDRKRRNQRIAAGVVGIAVFVAAVWIVTNGLSLDRSEKPVAPAGEVTGPAETAPQPPLASGAPLVVKAGMCSGNSRWRLEVTDTGDWIKVRFEVHQSPAGHEWRIQFRYMELNIHPIVTHRVFFHGTRVASDGGVFVVQVRHLDWERLRAGLLAKAVDGQTGQVCQVRTLYRD
jgi:hypothetical protein